MIITWDFYSLGHRIIIIIIYSLGHRIIIIIITIIIIIINHSATAT